MPKVNINHPQALFCVSTSKYFSTRIEAESEMLKAKDWTDATVDCYERDNVNAKWIETEWHGYEES